MKGSSAAFYSLGIASVASGVLVTFLPLYIFGITSSDFLAASISSIPSVSAIVAAPIWGGWKDRSVRAKPLMLAGVLPYSAFCFYLLLTGDVARIFAGWSIAALLTSSTYPVFTAFVTAGEKRRGASIGLLAAASAAGGAVGAIIGGITYQFYDIRFAFLLGGLSAIAAGAVIFVGVRENSSSVDPAPKRPAIATLKVLQDFNVLKPCISCFSYMVGITAFGSLTSIYVVSVLGGSRLLWGVSATLAYVLGAVAIAPIGRLSDRVGRRRVIRAGLVAQAALFTSFIFFRDPIFVAVLSVAPLVYIVCNTITMAVTDVTGERERGKAVGIQFSFLNAGGVVGPLVGGVLAEGFGFTAVLVFAVASVVFSLLWLQAKVRDYSVGMISN